MTVEIDKVYNCDCIDLIRAMKEQGIKADCLLTDIPYGEVNRDSNGLRNLNKKDADILTFDLVEYLKAVYEVVKGVYIIFCGTEQVSQIRAFFANKDCTTRLLIWEKTNPSPMNGEYVYLSGVECAVYAKKRAGVGQPLTHIAKTQYLDTLPATMNTMKRKNLYLYGMNS